MGNEVYSGIIAIGLGVLLGFGLFVPFVAISYRRRGGLTFGRFALWAAALVYFFAIWTYTLLPLPDPDDIACAGVNLDLDLFVRQLRDAQGFTDPVVLQLALNVLLFVPLGFFLRVLGGRGILVAGIVGLATSAFIETTQLTGVWGVYPCAYRVFDVDDMLTNTTGALLGSLLALLVPRAHRGFAASPDSGAPRPVTRARRLLAMLCDALAAALVAASAGVVVQLWLEYVVRDRQVVLAGTIAQVAAGVVPLAIWAVVVLVTGRSIGDAAVELRYRDARMPEPLARLLRFAGGIGGYLLLGLLPAPWTLLQFAFAIAAIVMVFTTASGRGLPGVLSRQRLADARQATTPPLSQ